MPACPLCENQQPEGEACDLCGRPFPAGEARAAPVVAIDGLEQTRYEAVPEPREALAELEPTAQRAPGDAPPERVEGLEPTVHAEAGEVLLDPVPDLEPTGALVLDDEPAARGPLLCRYCRTPATGWERLCLRCGMQLPVRQAPRRGAAAAERLCSDCGVPAPGPLCPACGARLPHR